MNSMKDLTIWKFIN